MKPYGREKKIKAYRRKGDKDSYWKKDFHIHINFRKIGNWWENMCTIVSRSTMKQNLKKTIKE
jgi:hypothetical protein